MVILSGINLRDNKKENLRSRILEIKKKNGDKFIPPTLVIFQVGENKASSVYIEQKRKFAEYIGAEVLHVKLPEHIEEQELLEEIKNYNKDETVHGIIVQLPLPRHISVHKITDTINYQKDVDGLSSMNLGLLVKRNFKMDENIDNFGNQNFKGFIPATAKGVLSLLDEYDIEVEGKKVCVLGRSVLVGKPTALALLAKNATVIICHSKTENLKEITKSSDILISAIGRPKFITKDFVKEGQIVIDVGITGVESKNENGEIIKLISGDVAFDEVSKIVEYISPVPGGIGPLTVASLFENLFESFSDTLV